MNYLHNKANGILNEMFEDSKPASPDYYKVDLNIATKNQPEAYVKLLKKEVSKGKGLVHVKERKNGKSGIYSADTHNYFLGLVWVPDEALTKVER